MNIFVKGDPYNRDYISSSMWNKNEKRNKTWIQWKLTKEHKTRSRTIGGADDTQCQRSPSSSRNVVLYIMLWLYFLGFVTLEKKSWPLVLIFIHVISRQIYFVLAVEAVVIWKKNICKIPRGKDISSYIG